MLGSDLFSGHGETMHFVAKNLKRFLHTELACWNINSWIATMWKMENKTACPTPLRLPKQHLKMSQVK